MRIAIVADVNLSVPKGDTIRTIALAAGLTQRGHEVELVVPEFGKLPPDFRSLVTQVGTVKTASRPRKEGFTGVLRRKRELLRAANKVRADLIQFESSFDAGLLSVAQSGSSCVDIHGIAHLEIEYDRGRFYRKNPPFLSRFLETMGARKANLVAVVSQSMKRHVRDEWGIPESRLKVIPNGYFPEFIPTGTTTPVLERSVTFTGAIARWACVDKLIRAAERLQDAGFTFTIIGDGPQRPNLEKYCHSRGIRNVDFTGFLSTQETYRRIRASEIVAAPFPDIPALQVACPIKLIEYGVMKKPMVIDPVGDLPRTLAERGGAVIPDGGSSRAFAQAIFRLAEDPQLRTRVAMAAYEVCHSLTWQSSANSFASIYDEWVHT